MVGRYIKMVRHEKGLTQKQLVELCGIDEANIRKYENEKLEPSLPTLRKIASALQVPLGILIGDWGMYTANRIVQNILEPLGNALLFNKPKTGHQTIVVDLPPIADSELKEILRKSSNGEELSEAENTILMNYFHSAKFETSHKIIVKDNIIPANPELDELLQKTVVAKP